MELLLNGRGYRINSIEHHLDIGGHHNSVSHIAHLFQEVPSVFLVSVIIRGAVILAKETLIYSELDAATHWYDWAGLARKGINQRLPKPVVSGFDLAIAGQELITASA